MKQKQILFWMLILIIGSSYLKYGQSACNVTSSEVPKIYLIAPEPTEKNLYGNEITFQWVYYNPDLTPPATVGCVINFTMFINENATLFRTNALISDLPTSYVFEIPSTYVTGTNMSVIFVLWYNLTGYGVTSYARLYSFTWNGLETPTEPTEETDWTYLWIILGVSGGAIIIIVVIRQIQLNRQKQEMYEPIEPIQRYQEPIYEPEPIIEPIKQEPIIIPVPEPKVEPKLTQVQPEPKIEPKKEKQIETEQSDVLPQQCLDEKTLYSDPVCIKQFKKLKGKTPQEYFKRREKV